EPLDASPGNERSRSSHLLDRGFPELPPVPHRSGPPHRRSGGGSSGGRPVRGLSRLRLLLQRRTDVRPLVAVDVLMALAVPEAQKGAAPGDLRRLGRRRRRGPPDPLLLRTPPRGRHRLAADAARACFPPCPRSVDRGRRPARSALVCLGSREPCPVASHRGLAPRPPRYEHARRRAAPSLE